MYQRPPRYHERNNQRWPNSASEHNISRHQHQPNVRPSAPHSRFAPNGGRRQPSAENKSFTVIVPPAEAGFTIVTNENNDFDRFSAASDQLPATRDIYSQLSLKQTNYFTFGSKASSDVLKMCFLYAVARLIYEGEMDDTLVPAIAAAEFAADYLPARRRLFGREADGYFESVMAKAVRNPTFILKVQPNDRLYDTLKEFGLPPIYPTPKPEPLDGDQYMRILQILSTSLDPQYAHCDLEIALTAIAPCLQLDCVTNSFLSRLEQTVRDELGKPITLHSRSTAIFYDQYLGDASEDDVEQMVIYWRVTLPETAERLRALLRRMPGNGLLPITLIGRALSECDDFPWRDTFDLYPEDWRAVDEAIRLINNDPFYGYRRDKNDVVHPRHYQNLAWLAKQLCIVKLNDQYPDYNLWVNEPCHANTIKKLIAEYVGSDVRERV